MQGVQSACDFQVHDAKAADALPNLAAYTHSESNSYTDCATIPLAHASADIRTGCADFPSDSPNIDCSADFLPGT